jgi:hypothetical protein
MVMSRLSPDNPKAIASKIFKRWMPIEKKANGE